MSDEDAEPDGIYMRHEEGGEGGGRIEGEYEVNFIFSEAKKFY